MWVRTTLTIKRWTEEKTGCKADVWDESDSFDTNRLPSWKRGRLMAKVSSSTDLSTFSSEGGSSTDLSTFSSEGGSSTDLSTFSSEGECKTERCCWKHKQCARHIIHPFSDYGHHNLHIHAVSHCNCDSRLKDCSEMASNSSFQDVGSTCSTDGGSTCFNIIHTPCFELIPDEECMERSWYRWDKSYRPFCVAVIHHPIHKCAADDINEEEEEEEDEEEEEESQPPMLTQVSPTATPPHLDISSVTGTPELAVPITIWRSDSPTEKSQGSKVINKVKKTEKDEMDEKAKLKKKVKKGKMTKKSLEKSQSLPAYLPRELARTSESSPESREELQSGGSYNDQGQEEPSSEDVVESSSSPKKREKYTAQAKKKGTKPTQTRKVNKRKSPLVSKPQPQLRPGL